MRIGVTLPTFRDQADDAVAAARRAETLGFDGVFVFDHLWPLGRPGRPALSAFPVLGTVAAVTSRICLGPLVARVGLVSDDLLVAQLLSLRGMAGGRLVAGLGTGDHQSAGENAAFGIAYDGAEARRLSVRWCATRLAEAGVAVWIGGGSTATTEMAAELGVALNLWEPQPAALAALSRRMEVTWAGRVPSDPALAARWLAEVSDAGATWAVCAWPQSLETLAEAALGGR